MRYVIHDDLAARNIVVCEEDEEERLVLVDFDCATVMDRADSR